MPDGSTRRRSRTRTILSALTMSVVAGILLVTVVDPYAGATASSFYKEPTMVQSSLLLSTMTKRHWKEPSKGHRRYLPSLMASII